MVGGDYVTDGGIKDCVVTIATIVLLNQILKLFYCLVPPVPSIPAPAGQYIVTQASVTI